MPRKQVGAIDRDLLDRVDEARGDVPRVKFVERALEAALGGESTVGAGAMKATARKGPDRKSPLDHDRSPASPRASDPAVEFAREVNPYAPGNPWAAPLSRRCEKCGKEFGSPSLRRCTVCNGKVVPEPVGG